MNLETRGFSELVDFQPILGGDAGLETHGTTVLTIQYDQGVLALADRRATMGNLIMFERAEKVFALDDATLIAISGAFARSVEICRFLQHSFKYFERLNLHTLSVEGKLMEISRALAQNLPNVMQGIGVFLPIVAAYNSETDDFSVYFFDTAGARFEGADYACAGSGSERIRGVFEYLARTRGPWEKRSRDEVLADALRMLDIAAQLDAATGGFRQIPPSVLALERSGVRRIEGQELQDAVTFALST